MVRYLGEMDKCNECGDDVNLIDHHVSYDPEIIKVLCRSCHIKFHKKYPDQLRRPRKYKTKGRKQYTTISLTRKARDKLIEYAKPRESWADTLIRLMKEHDEAMKFKEKYRLK